MNLLHLLIVAVLGALGGLIFLHVRRVGPTRAAASWPVAPGIMLATTVREPAPGGPPKYQPLVHYRYNVGGRDFEGVQLRLVETATFDRNKAYADIAPYAPGTAVHVRYNPQSPDRSVLELTPVSSPFLLIAGGLVLLIMLGIGAIVALESGIFDEPAAPYQPPPTTMNDMSSSGIGNTTTGMSAPTPTAPTTAGVNNHPTTLIGSWTRSGDCSRVMQFLADGTIINPGGERGTWRLQGVTSRQSLITISGGGTSVGAWLDGDGGSSFVLTPTDGSAQFTIARCY
ncbi:MAG TPA: DUF3592 domain-containing protein [Allosphingosinicella sp.]